MDATRRVSLVAERNSSVRLSFARGRGHARRRADRGRPGVRGDRVRAGGERDHRRVQSAVPARWTRGHLDRLRPLRVHPRDEARGVRRDNEAWRRARPRVPLPAGAHPYLVVAHARHPAVAHRLSVVRRTRPRPSGPASRPSSGRTARGRPTSSRPSGTCRRSPVTASRATRPLIRAAASAAVVRGKDRAGEPGDCSGGDHRARATPRRTGSTGAPPRRATSWACFAPSSSRPRISTWSRATPPGGGAFSMSCASRSPPMLAGDLADYERVVRQRTALLKSARGRGARSRDP